MASPPRRAWRERGADEEFRGRRIHLLGAAARAAAAPPARLSLQLLRLAPAARAEPEHAVSPLTSSASASPRSRATTTTRCLAGRHRRGAGPPPRSRPVFIVAHDMGTSVATELMARDIEGALEMELAGVLLLNGSMVQGAASPTLGQRLLRGRRRSALRAALQRALLPPAVRLDLLARAPAHRGGGGRPVVADLRAAAASGSATSRSPTWTSASATPSAGTARSATGRSRSHSPGGCSTRSRPTDGPRRGAASCGPARRSTASRTSATTRRSRTPSASRGASQGALDA